MSKNYILVLQNKEGDIASIDEFGTVKITQPGTAPELAKILYEAIAKEGIGIKAELEKVKKELLEWENREASVCPEGVPFERMFELQEEESVILTRMVEAMAQDLTGIKDSWNPKIEETLDKYRDQAEKYLKEKKNNGL